jgi:hypothetical protein
VSSKEKDFSGIILIFFACVFVSVPYVKKSSKRRTFQKREGRYEKQENFFLESGTRLLLQQGSGKERGGEIIKKTPYQNNNLITWRLYHQIAAKN